MKRILVTGGAGYIGSHTCVELLKAGYELVVVDNLSNSKEEALRRVQAIAMKTLTFYQVDLCDRTALEEVFRKESVEAVIHFAGLKAVGESVHIPLRYYYNNITGTVTLLEVMNQFNVKQIVFSSSATVYGDAQSMPIREDSPLLRAFNPYGRTKQMIEEILRDVRGSDPEWDVILLRYFNPVGAHPSGRIGEDPNGIPNNLVPSIAQVAVGKLPYIRVFGKDYPTPDGTGVRDYIHVTDLATGHLKALEKLDSHPGVVAYNLGTGRGYSVLEVIAAFQKACNKQLLFQFTDRRPGDVAISYADPSLANRELDWQAKLGIEEMCADTWRWQSQNPNGYN